MKNKTHLIAILATTLAVPCQAAEEEMKLPVGAKDVLKALDSNGDKSLDFGELEAAGPKNMTALSKRYDKDKDGTISLSEMGLTEADLKDKPKPKKKGGKKKGKKKRRR